MLAGIAKNGYSTHSLATFPPIIASLTLKLSLRAECERDLNLKHFSVANKRSFSIHLDLEIYFISNKMCWQGW